MKKILLALLFPAILFGSAGDIKIDVKNASDNAWISTIFAKQNGALLGTSGSGVPQLYTTIPSTITWNGATIDGQYGGTGVANTGKTITLGGNFATSGAFSTTLTVGATTNVTLPSSGTLAALDGTNAWTGSNTFSNATPIVLSSTATSGLQIYNTSSLVDFERLEAKWSGNVAQIQTIIGGTGTLRPLRLGALSASGLGVKITIDRSASNYFVGEFDGTNNTAGQIGFRFFGGSSSAFTQTSGTQVAVSITPTYNQVTSTAANTDLLVNRIQTSLGSGLQLLADFQVAGTSKFNITNAGDLVFANGVNNQLKSNSSGDNILFKNAGGIDIRAVTGSTLTFQYNGSNVATVGSLGFTVPTAIIATPQALSGAGAVNLTTTSTHYTSTGGAQALTLANGTAGQFKRIVHSVDGGSGVLTPTSAIGYTTITFTNVGDSVDLEYTAAGWAIVGINGATKG